jgi:hypothetical protein
MSAKQKAALAKGRASPKAQALKKRLKAKKKGK